MNSSEGLQNVCCFWQICEVKRGHLKGSQYYYFAFSQFALHDSQSAFVAKNMTHLAKHYSSQVLHFSCQEHTGALFLDYIILTPYFPLFINIQPVLKLRGSMKPEKGILINIYNNILMSLKFNHCTFCTKWRVIKTARTHFYVFYMKTQNRAKQLLKRLNQCLFSV